MNEKRFTKDRSLSNPLHVLRLETYKLIGEIGSVFDRDEVTDPDVITHLTNAMLSGCLILKEINQFESDDE